MFFQGNLAIAAEHDRLYQNLQSARVSKECELVALAKDGSWVQVEQLITLDPQLCKANNRQHNTCLHFAAKQQNLSVVELLLDSKAPPNATNELGFSPLHMAALSDDDHVESSRLLVGYGADLKQTAGMRADWVARYERAISEDKMSVESKVLISSSLLFSELLKCVNYCFVCCVGRSTRSSLSIFCLLFVIGRY